MDPRPVEDVTRLEIRVGIIRRVWEHPNADKLFCEEVDIGEDRPRLIASGLRPYYSLEDLKMKSVLVLANMKTKKLRSVKSHGMLLCASDGKNVCLLRPPSGTPIGELVKIEGYEGEPDKVMDTKEGKYPFLAVINDLKTDSEKRAVYKTSPLITSMGCCYSESIACGAIS